MKELFKKLFKNQLVAGSFVLFAGTMVANFGNYLYHLLMGRMLGPGDYGILASLISLTYLFSIPVGALSLVVVKYVSSLRGKKKLGVIAYFYSWLNKKLFIIGLVVFLFLVFLSPWLVSFLHLESNWPVLVVITYSLVGIYLTVSTATLQGFLRFKLMSVLSIIQMVLKVGIGVFLVWWGWRVMGATMAVLLAAIVAYLLTSFFVKQIFQKQKEKREIIRSREIFGYALPVFLSTLAFVSLYTTDIVLARHFLPAQEAGFYAALATLGKIIFFAVSPIIMVMFPMVSEKHANGKRYRHLFHQSLGLVFLICLGISFLYFFFPKLMVYLLYGSQYLVASAQLWFFALFLTFYSLAYLVVNFCLSIKKIRVVVLPVIAAFLQIILIFFFHRDLTQTVLMSLITTALLTGSLLVYNIIIPALKGN